MNNHVAKESHDSDEFSELFFLDEECSSTNQINDELDDLSADVLIKLHLSDRSAKFVLNSIVYVGGKEADDDSSDDESLPEEKRYNSSLHESIFDDLELNKDNPKALPYRQFKITKSRAKEKKNKDNFSEPVGLVRNKRVNLSKNAVNIAQAFVKKLETTGLEEGDCDNIENVVSASILLNRPLSISTRKNNLLENKSSILTNNTVSSPITVDITGVFWKFQWYNSSNKKVKYDLVRMFYKCLKKYDKIYRTSKAKKFKEFAEIGSPVPYRRLREYAKNRVKITDLIKNCENSDVYLSIVDGDTVSFNGIYSAYKREHSKLKDNPPRVMSTGCEYPRDAKCTDAFKLASQIDRKIRVITNEIIPGGVYFPEPNTCILVKKGFDTVQESFLDKSYRQDIELSCLLKHIKNEDKQAAFIFSSDNPLITYISDRARLNKTRKSPISFSFEFTRGSSPTKKDIQSLKQVAQSHFHESVWYDSLFINNAIVVKRGKGIQYRCKHLLARIRKNVNSTEATDELKKYILPKDVDNLKEAAKNVNEYVATVEINFVRSEDEDELLKHLNIEGIIDEERRLIFSQESVLKLIKDEKLSSDDIIDLKESSMEVLEFIFYNEEVVEALYDQDIDLDELLKLLKDNLWECEKALEEYSFSEILRRYEEDSRHIKFMGDPTGCVYENSDDQKLVNFGLEFYEVDVDWIRLELGESACARFEALINYHDEDPCEKHDEDYSDEDENCYEGDYIYDEDDY